MALQTVQGVVPQSVHQVRREFSQAEGGGASCPIRRPSAADLYVRSLIPKEVQLHASDQRRMRNALNELAQAPGRVYYDPVADKQAQDAYYGNIVAQAETMAPRDLFDTLSDLVSRTHKTTLDYSPSTELYPWVDLHPDGKLHSIYSAKSIEPAEAISMDVKNRAVRNLSSVAAAVGGSPIHQAALNAALPFNCEHVVPQSWFDKKLPMRGDLHHLFACDPGCNSMRGSVPYKETSQDVGTTCGQIVGNNQGFEPAGGKGAVARATLYFIMRYPGQVGDEGGEYTEKDLKTLIDWSNQNPVSEYERHRNAEIEKKQGNRNPLTDHPEWVNKIDFARGLGKH